MKVLPPEFRRSENGQGMVEYGLIVGLVAALIIAVFVALGPQFRDLLTRTVDEESVGEANASVSAAVYN